MQCTSKAEMRWEMSSDLDFENEMEISGRSFQEERNTPAKNQCSKHRIKNRAYVKEKY